MEHIKSPLEREYMQTKLRKGQELIWDSLFGYDTCRYIGECKLEEGAVIQLTSGILKGDIITIPFAQLYESNQVKINECEKKYNKSV